MSLHPILASVQLDLRDVLMLITLIVGVVISHMRLEAKVKGIETDLLWVKKALRVPINERDFDEIDDV